MLSAALIPTLLLLTASVGLTTPDQAANLAMGAAKEQHDAIPASLLADVSEFALPVLANQAWRLSARLRLFERVSP